MTTKKIFLDVILYITIAILLVYSAINYWKDGSKAIAALSVFVAALTVWQAWENVKSLENNTLPNTL